MKKDRYVDTKDWKGEVSGEPKVSGAERFGRSVQMVENI